MKDTFSGEHPSSNALKHGYNTVGTKFFAAGKVWDLLFWVLGGRPTENPGIGHGSEERLMDMK